MAHLHELCLCYKSILSSAYYNMTKYGKKLTYFDKTTVYP